MWDKELIKNWTEDNFEMFEGKYYKIEELEYIVKYAQVSLKSILITQKLTLEFCKKYLLDKNNKYSVKDVDNNISVGDIIYYQPHLKNNICK